MYRMRMRPAYTKSELEELYKEPHDHTRWPDHIQRVEKTVALGLRLYEPGMSIADLSCGNASIARGIAGSSSRRPSSCLLGDLAPGYAYQGPIEETINQIPHVELFICSETIEHLDDPDAVLRKIRKKSDSLLLSTPKMSEPDHNPEHYWAWDDVAVAEMLRNAGWKPQVYEESYIGYGYIFQIWGCI